MIFPPKFKVDDISIPHLVTIPYSHYCELARWALDISKTEYREMKYLPGYHINIVGKLRKRKEDRSSSSFAGQESHQHEGRRKFSVPLVAMPDGRILKDSWEILEKFVGQVDPYWKNLLDNKLGIALRQMGYFHFLDPENKSMLDNILRQTTIAERIYWLFFGGFIKKAMYKLMAISKDNIEESKKTIFDIFDEASERIKSNPSSITKESYFTPTDLAFCALGSIAVFPQNFSGNVIHMGNIEDFPTEYQNLIQHCRETEAGKFILSSYKMKRLIT
ncbi:hypothetical protein OAK75_08170 [Bacteriovoracales bacterium]|nr:hypothetical protein [Bacteriovoracales bacterium]